MRGTSKPKEKKKVTKKIDNNNLYVIANSSEAFFVAKVQHGRNHGQ